MTKWDDKENREQRGQKQKETVGKYMAIGGSSVLVLYVALVVLEFYSSAKCIAC